MQAATRVRTSVVGRQVVVLLAVTIVAVVVVAGAALGVVPGTRNGTDYPRAVSRPLSAAESAELERRALEMERDEFQVWMVQTNASDTR